MTWPYIAKEIVNVGSEAEPVYQAMPKMYWVPCPGRGPYSECRDCRSARAGNKKHKVGFAIMGAARCLKHVLRFHRDNGSLTDELKADAIRRDAIHDNLRKGAYA